MAKARSETIKLIGYPQRKEDRAVAALSPGHLVEFSGVGIRKQSVAKADCRLAFAFENELLGGTINDAYALNENVYYGVFSPGDELQARVAAAAGAIVKGDFLEAAGDGTLRKWTDGKRLAVATEGLDNSAGGAEAFINIEVL